MDTNIAENRRNQMSSRRRLAIWGGLLLLTLLLVFVALLFTATRIANSPSVKTKIQETVATQTGGQLDFQYIHLSLLPRLSIELENATLNLPETLTAAIKTLRIFPKSLPLLTGQFSLSRLEFIGPELQISLPDNTEKQTQPLSDSEKASEQTMVKRLSTLAHQLPEVSILIDRAQLSVSRMNQSLIDIKELNLRAEVAHPEFQETVLKLQTTCSHLILAPNNQWNNSQEKRQEPQKNSINDITLRSNLQISQDALTITIKQLKVAEPEITLAGSLSIPQDGSGLELKLSGTDIDIDAIRKSVLAIAGNSSPAKVIFDYLRGGNVPKIDFSSHGATLSNLGDLDNIVIEGQLQDGKVSIPPIKLDLTEVQGKVTIHKGVLTGSELSVRLANSQGQDGALELGLMEDSDLFRLSLELNVDIENAKTVLEDLVVKPAFKAELSKITRVQGTVQGRLSLGDSLSNIQTEVKVKDFQFTASHQALPWPITVLKGQFDLSEDHASVTKLRGTIGQSSFQDLSGQILWNKGLSGNISSGNAELAMAEIYPWLKSQEKIAKYLQKTPTVSGQLKLSEIRLAGDTTLPANTTFLLRGKTDDLTFNTEFFPSTIHLTGGDFTVSPKALRLDNVAMKSEDSSVTLTGTLQGFQQQTLQTEISLTGNLDAERVKWLTKLVEVPDKYNIRTPLTIQQANLLIKPASPISFNATFTPGDGPKVTTKISYQPTQLQIHNLEIEDQYSDISIKLSKGVEQNQLTFSGQLQQKTLDNIFLNSPFQINNVQGNLVANIPEKGPAIFDGKLTGDTLKAHILSGSLLELEQFALTGNGQELQLETNELNWKGWSWQPTKATLSINDSNADIQLLEAWLCGINIPGQFFLSREAFSLDINLEAKEIDLARSFSCLTKDQLKMSGTFDLSSQITGKAPVDRLEELTDKLKGPLKLTLKNGVITQNKLISRMLEVLNFTEIVKGRLPNLSSNGFPYTTITLQGQFNQGNLVINNFFMDGETLDVVGEGKIHLREKTIDAQLLAAPFKTVDAMVKFIPGVNYILAGNLVTIPISITGALADPDIKILSASAVGSRLYNLGERTIKSPIKLMKKILPWKK